MSNYSIRFDINEGKLSLEFGVREELGDLCIFSSAPDYFVFKNLFDILDDECDTVHNIFMNMEACMDDYKFEVINNDISSTGQQMVGDYEKKAVVMFDGKRYDVDVSVSVVVDENFREFEIVIPSKGGTPCNSITLEQFHKRFKFL
jgi:hypothetical protein